MKKVNLNLVQSYEERMIFVNKKKKEIQDKINKNDYKWLWFNNINDFKLWLSFPVFCWDYIDTNKILN